MGRNRPIKTQDRLWRNVAKLQIAGLEQPSAYGGPPIHSSPEKLFTWVDPGKRRCLCPSVAVIGSPPKAAFPGSNDISGHPHESRAAGPVFPPTEDALFIGKPKATRVIEGWVMLLPSTQMGPTSGRRGTAVHHTGKVRHSCSHTDSHPAPPSSSRVFQSGRREGERREVRPIKQGRCLPAVHSSPNQQAGRHPNAPVSPLSQAPDHIPRQAVRRIIAGSQNCSGSRCAPQVPIQTRPL